MVRWLISYCGTLQAKSCIPPQHNVRRVLQRVSMFEEFVSFLDSQVDIRPGNEVIPLRCSLKGL